MSDSNLISAQEMIKNVFSNIEMGQIEESNKLLKSWQYIIESIKSSGINGQNLGKNLYSHCRIIDLKNNVLLIEADHPGWIQTLKLYQNYIIKGLKMNVPDLKVSSLVFRLRGSNVELHSVENPENVRKEMKERYEKDEIALKKFDEEQNKKNNGEISPEREENRKLPENLQKILDKLKEDMLTNDE